MLSRVFTSAPTGSAECQALNEGRIQFFGTENAAGEIPDFTFLRRQMANVFGKKIDLGPSRFSVGPAAAYFTFARHGPVILIYRHRFEHLRVKLVGKNAIKSQMMERCIISVRLSHRVDHELN